MKRKGETEKTTEGGSLESGEPKNKKRKTETTWDLTPGREEVPRITNKNNILNYFSKAVDKEEDTPVEGTDEGKRNEAADNTENPQIKIREVYIKIKRISYFGSFLDGREETETGKQAPEKVERSKAEEVPDREIEKTATEENSKVIIDYIINEILEMTHEEERVLEVLKMKEVKTEIQRVVE